MATGTTYKWLEVMDGTPAGPAGEALNSNFQLIAACLGPFTTETRAPTVTDDSAHGCFKGSHWYNSATARTYFLVNDTAAAAVWKEIAAVGVTELADDLTPQLGGDLYVNGHAIRSTGEAGLATLVVQAAVGNYLGIGTQNALSYWPQAFGNDGEFLKTDGAGGLSWDSVEAEAGLNAVVEDTTPQLGGNLDINGQAIVSASNGNIPISPNGTGAIILDGVAWPTAAGSAGYVLSTNGSNGASWISAAVSGITSLIEDPSPQLGGNLDVHGYDIVSESNGNIPITPNGTGAIILDGMAWPTTAGSAGYVLKTNGAGAASWDIPTGGAMLALRDDTSPELGGDLDLNGHKIVSVSNGNVAIQPDGTGQIILEGLTTIGEVDGVGNLQLAGEGWIYPADADADLYVGVQASGYLYLGRDPYFSRWPATWPADGQALIANGTQGILEWATRLADVLSDTTPQLGGNLDVNGHVIGSTGNGNVPINAGGTGSVILDGLYWPQADGSNGQVLTTNGANQTAWATLNYLLSLLADTSPQLGGDLDVDGHKIVSTSNGNIALEPNGSGRVVLSSLTTIGSLAWPTTDGTSGQYVMTNGTGQLSFGTLTPRTVSITVPKGSTWANVTLALWQVFGSQAITITQVNATAQGSSTPTLAFNLEERAYASLNSTGTNVFSGDVTADGDGYETTSFDNAGLAAKSHLVLRCGATPEGGTVDALVILIHYTLA